MEGTSVIGAYHSVYDGYPRNPHEVNVFPYSYYFVKRNRRTEEGTEEERRRERGGGRGGERCTNTEGGVAVGSGEVGSKGPSPTHQNIGRRGHVFLR